MRHVEEPRGQWPTDRTRDKVRESGTQRLVKCPHRNFDPRSQMGNDLQQGVFQRNWANAKWAHGWGSALRHVPWAGLPGGKCVNVFDRRRPLHATSAMKAQRTHKTENTNNFCHLLRMRPREDKEAKRKLTHHKICVVSRGRRAGERTDARCCLGFSRPSAAVGSLLRVRLPVSHQNGMTGRSPEIALALHGRGR